MFRILFNFFGKWFDAVIRFLQISGGFLSYLISTGFAIVLAFMVSLTTAIRFAGKLLGYIVAWVDKLRIPDSVTGGLSDTVNVLSVLEITNTFFPLAESFLMMIALVTLAIACAAYGLVKSWIPTVSG